MVRYGIAILGVFGVLALALSGTDRSLSGCETMLARGLAPIADQREDRFLGKVKEDTALCRGGDTAAHFRANPWVDWSNYWATGDASSRVGVIHPLTFISKHLERNGRGVDGALLDLERQRVELLKFNLFDNYTYQEYVSGRDGQDGRTIKVWPQMRLPEHHPEYLAVGGAGTQICRGELIRFRTVDGICNDMRNPAMGSAQMEFSRNVQFEETFSELGVTQLVRNRHGDRIKDPLVPDPGVISRELFTRVQDEQNSGLCNGGHGVEGNSAASHCDYRKAPFFNVLAAFWIQFMTHDWFSHLNEGHNADGEIDDRNGRQDLQQKVSLGCSTHRVDNEIRKLTPEEASEIGCTQGTKEFAARYAQTDPPARFDNNSRPERAYKTTTNYVTAWWDASQIYGFDETSRRRVKIDPDDEAKLLLKRFPGQAKKDTAGYLPELEACEKSTKNCIPDPMNPKWKGQEAVGFPENFSVGLSFFHNLFAREHNAFVDAFKAKKKADPEDDSGLRRPGNPDQVVTYSDVSDKELFEIARLVVAAEIAKIHTIEWTTQLLYDEPLRTAMYSNWDGLLFDYPGLDAALSRVVEAAGNSGDGELETTWYSVLSSGAGIVGLGTYGAEGNIADIDYDNAGANHFGSPFNFSEEFISVYRLHPLVPDLIELREYRNPNVIHDRLPVVKTFRKGATRATRDVGLANLALSMGRQRLGQLSLQNQPRFLQNLVMPSRRNGPMKKIDVVALDIVRDRERGIPRFNEFRRQIGLRQLTSFDDFIDPHLEKKEDDGSITAPEKAELKRQRDLALKLREIYGTHRCDKDKIISTVQRMPDSARGGNSHSPFPNDCLGNGRKTEAGFDIVDNIEDLDTIVGYLAETARPHGFAISETQFQIFIVNASRRLYSDRFFTSSFRKEFYSEFGLNWVNNNGPERIMEAVKVNGHRQQVLPLKRILMRNLPELKEQLEPVINAFDPWARDRGEYYSLDWKPIPSAEADPAFDE